MTSPFNYAFNPEEKSPKDRGESSTGEYTESSRSLYSSAYPGAPGTASGASFQRLPGRSGEEGRGDRQGGRGEEGCGDQQGSGRGEEGRGDRQGSGRGEEGRGDQQGNWHGKNHYAPGHHGVYASGASLSSSPIDQTQNNPYGSHSTYQNWNSLQSSNPPSNYFALNGSALSSVMQTDLQSQAPQSSVSPFAQGFAPAKVSSVSGSSEAAEGERGPNAAADDGPHGQG